MSKQLAPFHFDIVGSFLRPAELKKAREAFNNGNITKEELTNKSYIYGHKNLLGQLIQTFKIQER